MHIWFLARSNPGPLMYVTISLPMLWYKLFSLRNKCGPLMSRPILMLHVVIQIVLIEDKPWPLMSITIVIHQSCHGTYWHFLHGHDCKTRKLHLPLIFTISSDEANPWRWKAYHFLYFSNDIEETCQWIAKIKWMKTFGLAIISDYLSQLNVLVLQYQLLIVICHFGAYCHCLL